MARRPPRSLPAAGHSASLTPEERLLAQQAFRYEVGILRAWEDVRRTSARAVDPRTWIRRHPMGSVLSTGALAAIFMMRRKRPASPPGIRAALASAGFLLLRRAAISGFLNRVLCRFTEEKMPDLFAECEAQFPVATRRRRRDPSPARN